MLETTPSSTITPATSLGHHGPPPPASSSGAAPGGLPGAVGRAGRGAAAVAVGVAEVGWKPGLDARFADGLPCGPTAAAVAASRLDPGRVRLSCGSCRTAAPTPGAAVTTGSCATAGADQTSANPRAKPVTATDLRANLTPTADSNAGTM